MKNKFKLKTNILAMKKVLLTVVILLSTLGVSFSQEGTLSNEQINVVKAYQPMLSDAFKISDTPERDTAVTYVPDMNYTFDKIKHETTYTISPIKPLRIKDESIKKLYRGFIKAGYGTKNTPYGEIFYNSLRSKEFDAGIHLRHISSSGKINDYGYPGMGESGVKIFGTKYFYNNQVDAELGYNRSLYHFYGYQKPPDILSKSETRHSFDDFFGNFALASSNKDSDRLKYKGGIGFYNFTDNKSNKENNFKFSGYLGKEINDFDLGGNIELDFLRYETKTLGTDQRTIVRLDPRFVKTFDRLKLTAGANIPIEINDLTKYHFYPHLRIDITLIKETMTVFGQLTGNLERNSYRNFSRVNPFLGRDFALSNTNNKLDVSGGLYIKLEKQLAVLGSVSLRRLNNDAFYRNIETMNTQVIYDVIYDNNTQTNIHLELIYEQNEKLMISLGADYNGNKPSREGQALFRPDFTFNLNGDYNIADKIYVKALILYVTPRYYIEYNIPGFGYDYKTIKGYVDASLGIDYRYSKVLSVFLNINNFTASKYSRWYNYPSYTFGALAGLTYSF